jgi:hypothetical protein
MRKTNRNCSRAFAAMWIALNDEPSDTDAKSVAGYISTLIAADMLGIGPADLALEVVALRKTFETNGGSDDAKDD